MLVHIKKECKAGSEGSLLTPLIHPPLVPPQAGGEQVADKSVALILYMSQDVYLTV